MNNLENLQKEVEEIKARNQRVEIDKAWEISWTRRILISILTYIIASLWLLIINESIPFLKAIVPTVGYLLSTISITKIKGIWVNKN